MEVLDQYGPVAAAIYASQRAFTYLHYGFMDMEELQLVQKKLQVKYLTNIKKYKKKYSSI
jgi:hypothetical protein